MIPHKRSALTWTAWFQGPEAQKHGSCQTVPAKTSFTLALRRCKNSLLTMRRSPQLRDLPEDFIKEFEDPGGPLPEAVELEQAYGITDGFTWSSIQGALDEMQSGLFKQCRRQLSALGFHDLHPTYLLQLLDAHNWQITAAIDRAFERQEQGF